MAYVMDDYPPKDFVKQSLTKREKWLYFVGFPTGHGAVDFPFGAMWLLAPAIANSFGMSPTQIGYLFTAKILGTGFAYIPAALIGETHLRRRFLPFTLFLVASSYFLAAAFGNYLIFVVFMVAGAAAAGAWHPVAMGTLTERMPDKKAFALGVHFVGGSVAEVIAPISAGFLLVITGWRQVMQCTIFPALILGAIFLRMTKYIQIPSQGSFGLQDIKTTLFRMRSPVTVLMFLVLGFHSMAIMGLFTMIPLYLQSERHLSSELTGSLFSLMIFAGAIGAPVLGTLTDSKLQRRVILLSLVGVVVATIPLVFGDGLLYLIPGIMMIGFLLLGLRPSLLAMLLNIIGGRQTTVMGIVLAASEIVGSFGSLLSGIIGEFDLSLSIIFVGIMAGLSALLLAFLPAYVAE